MRLWSRLAAVALAVAAVVPPAAPIVNAEEGKPPPDAAARRARIRLLYEKVGFPARIREDMKAYALQLTDGDAAKANALVMKAGSKAAEDVLLAELDRRIDDALLLAVLPVLEAKPAQEALVALLRDGGLMALEQHLRPEIDEPAPSAGALLYREAIGQGMGGAGPQSGPANEKLAINALRNLWTVQSQLMDAGKIDCDEDGLGEYGTFLELAGVIPVRAGLHRIEGDPASGSDFSKVGTKVKPPILSPAFGAVDGNGIVVKSGYCFRIFLPDSAFPPGFAYETGKASPTGVAGGTGKIGVDMAETCWCAYAWPESVGVTGTSAFYVSWIGDVLESPNKAARWSGREKAPPGASALLGGEFTSRAAVGAKGRDGEVWKLVKP